MKNIIYKGLFLLILGFIISCEPFLEETNENPNDPTEVSSAAILPTIQLALAYNYNANFSRVSCMWVQQIEGLDRQWAGFNSYTTVASDRSTDWSNFYVDVLQNSDIMIQQSSEAGYNHYVGAGQILKAFSLMVMTDYWNDIPYTEAFTGVENLQPAYDSQASIYSEIHSLLASGRNNFASSDGGLALSGDLIYFGDTSAWIKAAHAIDAKAYLHEGLLNTANYAAALTSIENAFDSSADDFNFAFGTGAATASPWYQFNRDRGDIGFSPTMDAVMVNLNDPRKDIYDGDNESTFLIEYDTHEFFTIDQAVDMATYTELMFAKAECLIATGGSQADISEAYFAGIESSFSSLGLDTEYSTYTTQTAVSPASITLENIITQKWLALYANPETYSDWRRTGLPSLTPVSGSAIPTRFLYPQTELDLNTNTPSVTLFEKVDWDTN
ncbi:SusD/RagB family nutrient-binding outer membrane lipoprotein [Maribacter sp. Asnod1-A12]|uniref:SusD/RagB family nutrient-binding outer membrane lipoprotein n=1 Tax=Maribacter sp. Asnod1-A12 TaxID=3160576 RepID=UPI00386E4B2D